MKAGRELDALVATEVMGLPRPLLPTDNEVYIQGVPFHGWPLQSSGYSSGDVTEVVPRPYSTDEGAAWGELVDKMKSLGWRVTVTDDPDHGAGAQFERGDDNGPEYELAAAGLMALTEWMNEKVESVPHALCLAALRALDVEVPE